MAQVIDPNSLLVKTDLTPITRAWLNNLISQLCFSINGIGVRMDGYDAAENTLVELGLANINSTLGPFLTTLQQAAQLGFLVAEADGVNLSLVVGQRFDMQLTSTGAELFTPTKWLMVMDVTDSTNWGVCQLVSWTGSPSLGLATTCIYASKTKVSTQWQVTCGSGVLQAMVDDLNAAQTAATNAQTANTNAQAAAAYVAGVQSSIAAGPVVSVAGKTGAVSLVESDIANLTSDLAGKATQAYVNSATSGLQPHSANLDTLAGMVLSAFIISFLGAANATAAMSTLGAAPLASPTFTGAPAAPTPAANDNTTKLATTAFVLAQIAASTINSTQIAAVFDDQTGTTYTFTASDNGRQTTFTNASPITATLPNSLPKGWNALVWQGGAGQVTLTAAAGATLRNRQSQYKTAGQYAVVSLMCMSNTSGTNAVFVLGGDTAA